MNVLPNLKKKNTTGANKGPQENCGLVQFYCCNIKDDQKVIADFFF